MKRLAGKSALITGAARGIGRGFAESYVAEGAMVAIADINLEAAEKTAAELGDAAYAVQIDVSNQDSIDAAIASVVSHADKLDILINNAALFDAAETVDITRESFGKLYAVNVAGTLFTMQEAAKQMIAQLQTQLREAREQVAQLTQVREHLSMFKNLSEKNRFSLPAYWKILLKIILTSLQII